jgi:flagellar biogenesis protein FliO
MIQHIMSGNLRIEIVSLVLVCFVSVPVTFASAQNDGGSIVANPLRGNPEVSNEGIQSLNLVNTAPSSEDQPAASPAGEPEKANTPELSQNQVAASNHPATTRVAGIEALVGQGIWNSANENQIPSAHQPTGPIRSLSEPHSESQKPIYDSQIQLASLSASETTGSRATPFAGPASLELSETVRKIAFATAVSMLGCVVLVFVAKLWQGRRSPATQAPSGGGRNRNTAPRVEQSLSLGNKSLLRLVRVGNQQVLVATDATGIKSVLAIQPDFDSMLDDKPDSVSTESDLQKMLASFLDNKSK